MINLEAKTKLTPEEVVNRLKKFSEKGDWEWPSLRRSPSVSPLKGVAAM